MRIVIDMQGAQTESRFRGIGRYTLSFAQAVVRNRGEHEVILALSGLFPDTIDPIRAAFNDLLPQENIRIWQAPGPVLEAYPGNDSRREVAELIREAFLASLQPNVIHISSLFEGYVDNAVTSIGCFDRTTPVSVALYDLIPLLDPDRYIKPNMHYGQYYNRKIDFLKRAAVCLAISESSRQEGLAHLNVPENRIVNVAAGCEPYFKPLRINGDIAAQLLRKFGLNRPFVLCAGGADERKNLPRLMQAFAALPAPLRAGHQLLLAGKMPEGNIAEFNRQAKTAGLRPDELRFPGYVTEEELIHLYNLCKLFIFPSWHEGFGLPALEAMACGVPVIGANTSSLPEVIGLDDALFDPFDTAAIAKKMAQALEDGVFRKALHDHGLRQAKRFSWDKSAKRAIAAFETISKPSHVVDAIGSVREVSTGLFKPLHKRILVVKLDHMGDFILAIPAIMKLRARYPYAKIDALVGSWNVAAAHNIGVFERVHILDFFSKSSADAPAAFDGRLRAAIGQMEEYDLAIDLRRQQDTRSILLLVPARSYAGYAVGDRSIDCRMDVSLSSVPDVPFQTTELNRMSIAQQMLRLVDSLPADVNDYISLPQRQLCRPEFVSGSVAVFPKAGNNVKEWGDENFEALIGLLATDADVSMVNVYTADHIDAERYGKLAGAKIHVLDNLPYAELVNSLSSNTVCVANNSFGAHLAALLGVLVVGIYAGHETVTEWAPVFGCVRVIYTPVKCSPCHIARREDCGHDFQCLTGITVDYVHAAVMRALKGGVPSRRGLTVDDLLGDLLQLVAKKGASLSESDLLWLATCIAGSIQPKRKAQLFVDISELVSRDARTGIQRVVRNVLKEWMDNPPAGYVVEPVYATVDQGYRYARSFTRRVYGSSAEVLQDEPIGFTAGDIFFGLDLQPHVVFVHRSFFQELRRQGVQVKFAVYDLLCVLMPQYFPHGSADAFTQWLKVVAESDGAICISRTVAGELADWVKENGPVRERPFMINWSHLGADRDGLESNKATPIDADAVLDQLRKRKSFLMVGTLEPRKGYLQCLRAFEQLWQSGMEVNLVIVGKQGWMVENLADCLRGHHELKKRLFWLEGISDGCLDNIYTTSTCLIAASEGEGFGLPLIEAAQHKLPIIARDIPVFREVSGQWAYYFSGTKPVDLSEAVKAWLELYRENRHPRSIGMPWLTWEQSASRMRDILLKNDQFYQVGRDETMNSGEGQQFSM